MRGDSPEVDYFLTIPPKVFASARGVSGRYWQSHALRSGEGRFIAQSDLATRRNAGPKENPQIITIAGWRDVAALVR